MCKPHALRPAWLNKYMLLTSQPGSLLGDCLAVKAQGSPGCLAQVAPRLLEPNKGEATNAAWGGWPGHPTHESVFADCTGMGQTTTLWELIGVPARLWTGPFIQHQKYTRTSDGPQADLSLRKDGASHYQAVPPRGKWGGSSSYKAPIGSRSKLSKCQCNGRVCF